MNRTMKMLIECRNQMKKIMTDEQDDESDDGVWLLDE